MALIDKFTEELLAAAVTDMGFSLLQCPLIHFTAIKCYPQ